MRLLLALVCYLAGCSSAPTLAWLNFGDTALPLVRGGAATLVGFDVPVDATTRYLLPAGVTPFAASYAEGPDPRDASKQLRSVLVSGLAAGEGDLVLTPRAGGAELAHAHIVVDDVGRIAAREGGAALFVDGVVALGLGLYGKTTALPLLGVGPSVLGCSANGAFDVDAACGQLRGRVAGDGHLTVTANEVVSYTGLGVITPADVRAVRLLPPSLVSTEAGPHSVRVRVIADSDAGPAYGGAFDCQLDGVAVAVNAAPDSGAGAFVELGAVASGSGAHVVRCALGAAEASLRFTP